MLLAAESVSVQAETLNVTTFSNSGVVSWTVPTGVNSVLVEVQGGGGGSGGCTANSNTGGGGGGGGGYASQTISVTPGEIYTATVGAVGSAGASGDNDGGVGGTSRFNNSLYEINATGGAGGLRGSTGTGGAGGTGASSFPGTPVTYTGGVGGDKNATYRSGGGGGGASRSGNGASASLATAGAGNIPYSGIGAAGLTADGAGTRGVAFSSGGGGAACDTSSSVRAGATGNSGVIVLNYRIPSISGYPSIINISQGSETSTSNSHTVLMPSGIITGDLLLLVISSDANPTVNTTTDSSWTSLHQLTHATTVTQAVFYKFSNGTEISATVGTTSTARMTSYTVLAIREAGTPVSSTANASSTNANPPSLDTGTSQKYLWIAPASWDLSAGFNVTSMPSGFNSFVQTAGRSLSSVTTAVSWYYYEGSSLDPGTYTSFNEQWVASTIAILYNASSQGGYVVNNISTNLSVVLANDTNVNLNESSQAGIAKAILKHTTKDIKVALIDINFTSNLDLGSLKSDVDVENRKSYVHGYDSINEIVNISLLIPKINGVGSVFICPGAQSLDQVNISCAGLVNISVGETINGMSVSEVSYDGQDYYLVSNITGTGGGEPDASGFLQCLFIQSTTCPAGLSKLLGLENDTDGYVNAHVQNNTLNTYAYSLCCNSTNSSINISANCPGNDTVVRLSNVTNAHVELGNHSTYTNLTCLGSDWKKINCEYPEGSCATNYVCIMSIAGSEGTNKTNAHVGNCSAYNQKICCALTNYAPVKPTLYYPANNTNVSERRPNFNWSTATDPDGGNAAYYTLNISCGSCSASCYQPNIGSITITNYTILYPLCVDTYYNWSVTACDEYGMCNSSVIFNFTVKSYANLILIVNATNFTNMSIGQNKNTLTRNPTQLVAANIGNVLINVTINATSLFDTVSMGTAYYQFEASTNRTGSFTTGCSQMAFTNMSLSAQNLFCNMTYENLTSLGNNTGNIELNITVPFTESPGAKTSNIEVGYYAIS